MISKEPKLLVVAGPITGSEIGLPQAGLTIGREAGNDVCLPDLAVSRRHCVIEAKGADFNLRDLGSFNGCFVNGVPVKERLLQNNDRVVIGDSHFLVVLDREDDPSSFSPVQLNEAVTNTQETVRLRREDVEYFRSGQALADLPANARLTRDINDP